MGVTPQGDPQSTHWFTYHMDTDKQAEVGQSSQNAQPSGSHNQTDSKEKGRSIVDAGSVGLRPDNLRTETELLDSDGEHMEVASQASGTTEVMNDIRSLSLQRTGFLTFDNVAQKKAFNRALKAGKTRAQAIEAAAAAIPGPPPRQGKKAPQPKRQKGARGPS